MSVYQGCSLVLSVGAGAGLFLALQQGDVEVPFDVPAGINDYHVAAISAIFVQWILIIIGWLFGMDGESAKSTGKKKKKKKNKSSSKAKSGEGGGGGGPSKKTSKAKGKPSGSVKGKDVKAVPAPSTSTSSKGKKGGKKEKKEAKKEVVKKEKRAPQPKKVKAQVTATNNTKWALLADDEEEVAQPRKTNSATKGGYAGYDSDDNDSWDTSTGGKPSKAALRRRRQAQNKDSTKQQSASVASAVPDEDGFVTHTVKRRVKKAPVPDYSNYGGYGEERTQGGFSASVDPNASVLEIDVPIQKFGLLIGPKGATLLKLQEATGCKIDVPKGESVKQTVTVTGPKEGASACKQAIMSLVKQGYSSITDPGMSSSSLQVQPQELGIMIGPKGSNIKLIQDALNVRINTPDRGSDSNKVTISGDKDAVAKAKDCIKQLLSAGYSAITHPGYVTEYVNFPPQMFNLLIGPGGQMIKSIQGDTSCKVNIPDMNADDDRVAVVGLAADVKRAKIQIERLLDVEYQAAKQKAKVGAVEEEDPFDW